MSAFLIELLGRLEPDPLDTIQDVLIYQTQMMRNSSLGPYVPADFSPPEYIVLVNALFYASLGVMLLAAFIAMLIKSWVREFDRGLRAISIPEQRAKTREFRYLGMERWMLQEMVAMLPYLIQISLLLFAIGLVLFLFHISKPSFGVTTAIFGIGVLYYALTTTISIFVTSSPFHSPLSRTLGKVYQRVHAFFCPGLDAFLSPNMDITPVSPFGRLRRHTQVFLQKSRPYLESAFVESIKATTVDDVQLSTTASALRRIHDSVPNAQHSELIHQSVWQVAGSSALRMRPSFRLPSWILDKGNDKEYFSRLSLTNVVALKAVFVRIRDPRYKKRFVAVADIRGAARDTEGPWAQLVHAMFDLLPDNFFPEDHYALFPDALHDALHCDALLRDVLPDAPLFDAVRDSLLRNTFRNTSRNTSHGALYRGYVLRSLALHGGIGVALSVSLGVVLGGGMGALFGGGVGSALGIVIGILFGILFPLRCGALLPRGVPNSTPSFALPFLRALLYLYALLHDTLEDASLEEPLRNALLLDAPFRCALRLFHFVLRSALFGNPRFDSMAVQGRIRRAYIEPEEPHHIHILRTDQLQEEEYLWLLNTLSGLQCDGLVLTGHHVSKICLAIILHQAPKWNPKTPPNIKLIEAVVTLVAIACSSTETYQMKTLTNSHQHPWLLLKLRNIDLVGRMIENMDHSCRKELISLLFLVIYALLLRRSKTLAARYLAKMIAKCDFFFCLSALTAIAPALGDDGIHAIGGLPLLPQTEFLIPEVDSFMSDFPQLGASQFPDPNSFAILLLLSKRLRSIDEYRPRLRGSSDFMSEPVLGSPRLPLIAKLIARIEVPDKYGLYNVPYHDRRVHNMFAALFLRQYPEVVASYYDTSRQFLLLASFLESRELDISFSALHHHMRTMISSPDLPLPSCHLSGAVHAVFSPVLPDRYFPRGWRILHLFVDGFEKLPVEWRQTFAKAFFTVSRRPQLRENRQNSTPVTGLNEIVTWEYFCKKERSPEFTDTLFSGLDWVTTAWSLQKVAVSEQREEQPPGLGGPPEKEEFVLRVLCKLLDIAPFHSIIPTIPKLREFVEQFDDPELLKYHRMIFAMIEAEVRRHQECKTFDKFQRLHCMWYL